MALHPSRSDLVGASDPSIALNAPSTTTRVTFQESALQAALARITGEQRHVSAFLNLENLTGSAVHGNYEVYINAPAIADQPNAHPPLLAGHLSTFGVRKASDPDNPHGGSGITTVLDISKLVHQLRHERGWDGRHLDVTIVHKDPPGVARPTAPTDLKVGRVSVYYS